MGTYALFTDEIQKNHYEIALTRTLDFLDDVLSNYQLKNSRFDAFSQTRLDVISTDHKLNLTEDKEDQVLTLKSYDLKKNCKFYENLDQNIENLNKEIEKTVEDSKIALKNPLNQGYNSGYKHSRSRSEFLAYLKPTVIS